MQKLLALSLMGVLTISGCTANETLQSSTETNESIEEVSSTDEQEESYSLYLTTMTHMEGDFTDDENEFVFNKHVEELRFAMDLAEEYEATLTIETEKPFARANTIWGLNIMEEVLDRGHGVGTHCDVGGPTGAKLTPEEFAEEIKENKTLVDNLVGAENNHGCSGAGGYSDWAQAMVIAGFDYINGIVGMHLLAVPEKERPMAWDDKFLSREGFHYSFPEDYLERIYLYQLKDTTDWEADTEGIVISSGELGRFDALAEGGYENRSDGCVKGKCEMTMEDVDVFVQLVEEIHSMRDTSKVAKMTLYFPANNFEPENEAVLRAFFEAAQSLQQEGKLEWATQWEVVETYLNSLE